MTSYGFDGRCMAWRDAGINRVNCRDQPWFSQVPTVLRRTTSFSKDDPGRHASTGKSSPSGTTGPITDGTLASGWGEPHDAAASGTSADRELVILRARHLEDAARQSARHD